MKHSNRFLLALLFALTFVCEASAGYDVFLKLTGIEGESTATGHTKEIDVLSFSFGVQSSTNNPVGGSGGGANHPTFSDVTISKLLDKSSPTLFLKCANGDAIAQAILILRYQTGGQTEFYKISMDNVHISSVSNNGNAGGTKPTETVTFTFTKIEWKYQAVDGSFNPVGPSVTTAFDFTPAP